MSDNISEQRLSILSILTRLGIFVIPATLTLSLLIVLPALATGIIVNSPADTVTAGDGICTLREALNNANSNTDTTSGDCAPGSGNDSIGFAPALQGQIITLGGTELVISSNVIINGPGADQLTLSGDNASRVFSVTTGIAAISGLTIRDGRVTDANGGGIYNNGNLTLDHVSVQSNTIAAGAITDGGGIFNSGTLTVTHSAIISNSNLGSSGRGGGLAVGAGRASIINSTISGNTASYYGGGLLNTGGVLTAVHSTVAYNQAVNLRGGGIYNGVKAGTYFKNSLIANNTDNFGNNDCYYFESEYTPFTPISLGYNLVENKGPCTFSATGDSTNKDPQIGPLTDNGGPTLSHALLTDSPANEKIPSGISGCGDPLTTDQRDFLRLADRACSIGATEYNGIWLTLRQTVDDATPDPAQTITYTLIVPLSPSGNVSVTHALLTDTLPAGINFVGPISIHGGRGGVTDTLPTLAHSLTITGGNPVTVTFPVTVSTGIKGSTVLTASAAVSSAEVTTPVYASLAITVNNVPPVGVDDTATAFKGSDAISISVTANDYDLNGDVFTLTHVALPNNGGTADIADQKINYAPAADFTGTETFTYTITDAELTATGVVTVTVSDTPPVYLPLIIKHPIATTTVTLKTR